VAHSPYSYFATPLRGRSETRKLVTETIPLERATNSRTEDDHSEPWRDAPDCSIHAWRSKPPNDPLGTYADETTWRRHAHGDPRRSNRGSPGGSSSAPSAGPWLPLVRRFDLRQSCINQIDRGWRRSEPQLCAARGPARTTSTVRSGVHLCGPTTRQPLRGALERPCSSPYRMGCAAAAPFGLELSARGQLSGYPGRFVVAPNSIDIEINGGESPISKNLARSPRSRAT
jgi:hypothetical protein